MFDSFINIVYVKRVLLYAVLLLVLRCALANFELISVVSGHLTLALVQILYLVLTHGRFSGFTWAWRQLIKLLIHAAPQFAHSEGFVAFLSQICGEGVAHLFLLQGNLDVNLT